MLKVKIAVLVSGGGTNLQALIDAQKRGEIPHGELVLVISNNEGVYALERAKQAGIETSVVSRKGFGDRFEAVLQETLEQAGVELIVLAGFMCILSKEFTSAFSGRIINVHPSLIPSFCGKGFYGLKVHEAALEYGVTITGATVHFVNEVTDGGAIILQKAVEVLKGDTPEVLQNRVMEQAEWILLPQATELICKELSENKKQLGE